MSYLVLARKWRPQTFRDVVAQSHVVQALQNAIRLERLPHALLLTGSRGIGKTTIARLVAKTINCRKFGEGEEIEPCNECEMCKEITEGRATDVIEIDGASNRSIDDIREIRDNVQYLPTKGRRKAYIIDEVHMLTREAFNALLKTLEEPPEHVIFLFATTEPHKIPITILSRCQRFDFKRISLITARDYLKHIAEQEGLTISDVGLSMVARAASGGMRDAMSLLDQVIAFGGTSPSDDDVAQSIGAINRALLHQIGTSLLQRDAATSLRCVEELFSYAYDMRQLTQELATFLRDLLVVRICEDPRDITDLGENELKEMREIAKDAHPEVIQQMFRILTQEAEHIAQSSNPRLFLEMTLIRMARLEPVRPFDELLRQLDELQARVQRGGGGGPAGGGSGPTHSSQPPPQGQGAGGLQAQSAAAPAMSAPPVAPAMPTPAPATEGGLQTHTPEKKVNPFAGLAQDFEQQLKQGMSNSVSKRETPRTPEPAQAQSHGPTKREERSPQSMPELSPPTPQEVDRETLTQDAPVSNEAPSEDTQAPSEEVATAPVVQAPVSLNSEPFNQLKWRELFVGFRDKKPFVAPHLEFARISFEEKGILSLSFAANYEMEFSLFDEKKIEMFEAFLREAGYDLKVRTRLVKEESNDTGGVSLYEARQKTEREARENLEFEARNHPMIKSLLRAIPGSQIARIQLLSPEQGEESEE
ncbi:MAG TPA: hypothetical protein DCE42_26120 [Myxococcales bacterium]|nr:hypothetical protein [Myxococcales bacterium]